MSGFTEISAQNLFRLIGTPTAPVIIDVCVPEDVAADPFVIPTSIRIAHTKIAAWAEGKAGQRVVVVCQKGKKLSHGSAAILRTHGIQAEVLSGGMAGWVADGLPRTAISALPASSLWVTRARPKIDRIACPWLIRRFVDPAAQFLFVPAPEVSEVAKRFDATPFDVADTRFTHVGNRCTFDAMLDHFGLATPPLQEMAKVIRAADTDTLGDVPQAAGLLAISVGLSRMYKDDLAQLDAGMTIYDALYRWARDGQTETHSWPQERTS
ncbi:chromate resistance protein ChrB domain-containing protein [Yoonia sp. 208BN28-4]|uniref:chromate resistance protein ChrB domain-containing protein n=1 Tax=Yoonia sp. 208BN28-4 TaxID=3126505 RepID=UPI00309F470A